MAKIKVGGSVSYKIQIAPFESLETSAFMEVEDDKFTEEELQEKLNISLKAQVNKRMEIAVKNYHENIERLKKLV